MARSSKVEACMFCASLPCECNSEPQKPPRRSAGQPDKKAGDQDGLVGPGSEKTAVSPTSPPVRPSFKEAMKARAAARPRIVAPPPKPEPPVRHKPSDDELVFQAAIRALGPILHHEEKERFKMILTTTESLEERSASWKARRRVVE